MTAYRDNTGRWRFRKWVRLPNGQRERISGTPTQNTKRAAEAEERAAIQRDKQEEKLKASTINIHLRILHRVLTVAQEWQIIEDVLKVQLLKVTEAKFDYLTFEEAESLPPAAEMPWRNMIIVGLKTGLRRGELLGLHREDVDLDGGRLIVRRSASACRLGPTKSGKMRIVPLGRMAHKALASQLRSHQHEVVFCDEEGRLFWEGRSRRGLQQACERAGLRPLGWHALRHTFASHLVMRGAPLKAVQELLGHASIQMTMRYAHLTPCATRT